MKRSLRYLLSASPLLVTSLVHASDRSHVDAFAAAAAAPLSVRPLAAPTAVVTSIDAKRGVPTMLRADPSSSPPPRSQTPELAALEHLASHAERYGLSPSALASAEVVSVLDTGRGGILAVVRQRVDGLEVVRHDAKVLMDRELRLVAIGGNLHASAVSTPKHGAFTLGEADAMAMALGDLYDAPVAAVDLAPVDVRNGYQRFAIAGTPAATALGVRFLAPSRVKRVYFPLPDRLVPAYFLEVSARGPGASEPDAYAYAIAADDGRILYRENLTHEVKFSYRVWAETKGDLRPLDGPLADYTPYPATAPNGSYPSPTAPPLVAIDGFNKTMDPWLPDGATQTQGNNVDAYTDNGNPEGFSAGDVRATVTAPGVFDRVYDTTKGPQSSDEQRMAAVAQIFYVTNWLHDWWYDSGFDEKGNNAQASNYGRGGVEGDPLDAEGQFDAPNSRNNANMAAFGDGMSPHMHMFVWDGIGAASVTLQPGNQSLPVGTAAFGPQSFDVTGTVVQVDDGTAPNDDACTAITNDVSGKIALVRRGMCPFEQKTQAAQAAGAIGVILYNNTNGGPPSMGGNGGPGDETIGTLSITLANGQSLQTALAAGTVTATLSRKAAPDVDGTIDNTVVAHEWGHYLHLRNVQCGSQMCSAESEGWADFDALMMVVREGDAYDGIYPLAVYATGAFPDDPAYFGIRRYPYSSDMTKNPLTFKNITDGVALPTTAPVADNGSPNSEVHAAGEIWAAMLFEAYRALLSRTEGASPAYDYAEAHRRMSDYVVAGMRLAPVDPTYTEQRDGILAAAATKDPMDVELIAQAFAKRGAGTCAVSPARDSQDFSGVVESFKVEPNVEVVSVTIDDSTTSCDADGNLDAGETGKLTVVLKNAGTAALATAAATVTTTSKDVIFPAGPKITFSNLAPFGSQTASIAIGLASSVTKSEHIDLVVTLDTTSCGKMATTSVSPLVDFDEVKTGQTVDTVEAVSTAWTLSGTGADQVWTRAEGTAGNHVWAGIDSPSPSDTSLVSPPLMVSATDPLVLTFKERHQFENSMGVNWDGAVVEISLDAGKTWQDISMYGNPGYGGQIGDPQNQATNVLKGRQGYVDHNAKYPAQDTVTVDMGTKLAGKTVQVRFRIGTDDASGNFGLELDDIGLTGITNAPFSGVVDNVKSCSGGMGGAGGSAGAGGSTTSAGGQSQAGHGGAAGGAHAGAGGTAHAGAAGAGGAHAGAAGAATGGMKSSAGGSGGSAGTSSDNTALQAQSTDASGGCGCETAPSRAPGGVGAVLLGLAGMLVRRRRSSRES